MSAIPKQIIEIYRNNLKDNVKKTLKIGWLVSM